ncbi:MAG: hypothetical protein MJ236_05930 [Clostridia bacterium]|nr:hypothetical protein [Clostridia bacterium]
MAFIKVEDRYGEIEVIVFPKVLSNTSYMLNIDMPIAVTGEISVSDDNKPKILAKTIVLLSSKFKMPESGPLKQEPIKQQVPQKTDLPSKLYIKVKQLDGHDFQRIMTACEICEGNIPVIFFDDANKKYIKANNVFVNANQTLINLLKDIVGSENVVLK